MKVPGISCKITGHCDIRPSEDSEKIFHALSNVLPDSEIHIENNTAKISANDLNVLVRIFETIHSRKSQRAYLRRMRRNLDGSTTWFYLNKQAAYANTVALCDDAEESPLGPIKIILHSNRIEQVMEWLTYE